MRQPAGTFELPSRLDCEPGAFRAVKKRSPKMDWDRVEGNWKQAKGKVKEQWGKITDDDPTLIDGKRDQLEGTIQERYGIQKDIARKQIDDWQKLQTW
jgi:uncharacterized protein YjbJ (UPF0337 family)